MLPTLVLPCQHGCKHITAMQMLTRSFPVPNVGTKAAALGLSVGSLPMMP